MNRYRLLPFCLRLLIFSFFVIEALVSCDKAHSSKCTQLGKKRKLEKEYVENHQPGFSKVKVYVENSGSMDGYVNGNTEFKTDLFNLLKLMGGEISGDIEKFFINDSVIKVKLNDSQFSNGMSVKLFQDMGGKRGTSDIAELIAKVIRENKPGEISVFISDCVFDPQSSPDIEKRLSQQKTTIRSAIKSKLKSNDEFSVVVYGLMSSFTGTYYNKVKPHKQLVNVQRPYYIWFFGDAYQLAKVRTLLQVDIEGRSGTHVYTEIAPLENLPYKCPSAKCNMAKGKHIDEPRERDGKFLFNIDVDLSTLPLSQKYMSSTSNYILSGSSSYVVESVDNCDKKDECYTHEIEIKKIKGSIKENTSLIVELQRSDLPSWIDGLDDPNGSDYLNGKNPPKARTFGLKSYISGVHEAYDDTPIAKFEILIK